MGRLLCVSHSHNDGLHSDWTRIGLATSYVGHESNGSYFFASAHVNYWHALFYLRSRNPFQHKFGYCVCNVTTQRDMYVMLRIQPGMTCSLIQQHVCVMGTFKVV